MKGKLWINPFLDTFYKWGLGKYWEDKLSFLKFLDNGDRYLGFGVDDKMEEYIKEKVPEWYWKNGFDMRIGQGGVVGDLYYDTLLLAWESGEPFRVGLHDEWTFYPDVAARGGDGTYNPNLQYYIGYPEYLKRDGNMLSLYSLDGPYIKIIRLYGLEPEISKGMWFYNSLFFTTEKGKSWCDVSSTSKFLNWMNENPFEVKQ